MFFYKESPLHQREGDRGWGKIKSANPYYLPVKVHVFCEAAKRNFLTLLVPLTLSLSDQGRGK
jgi:hypothetical protein